jgi:hypothetical protein
MLSKMKKKGVIKMKKFCLLFSLAVLFMLWIVPAGAQLNPFAPPSASEPLTSASPTGGLTASTYTGRARAAAAVANAPAPAVAPPAAAPRGVADRVNAGPPGEFGKGTGQPAPEVAVAAPAPAVAPAATPAIKFVKVLAGERIKDAVNGTLLEDIHYEYVPETMLKDRFYDDGTHGDQEAGDGLYTNITERSDVLGSASNDIKLQLFSLLRTTEETSPLDFFRLHVTTSEPISSIPSDITQEKLRDERLKEWNRKFLRGYRKNPDEPTSEFYPVYVPQPPRVPVNNPPMPPGFNPVEQERLQEEAKRANVTGGGGGFRGIGAEVEGAPQGAASSRYYDRSKMP